MNESYFKYTFVHVCMHGVCVFNYMCDICRHIMYICLANTFLEAYCELRDACG